MTTVQGQASVEYAGLLALAALFGAALAMVAGPPLVGAIRNALVHVLPGSAHQPALLIASAADIADVQSALLPTADAMTPDAALLALGRRHGDARAEEVADVLLLAAARDAVPWLGRQRTYRAWKRLADGPYHSGGIAGGDRDVEIPTAGPATMWITVADQRNALATALAHDTSPAAVTLDALAFIPGVGAARAARAAARPAARVSLRRLPQAADRAGTGSSVVDLVGAHDGDVPAGMRAGDVVITWPVHRMFWRNGREDATPLVDLGTGLGSHPPARDYEHVVFLRPGSTGLEIVAEGFRP
jgi:hypothetical protein